MQYQEIEHNGEHLRVTWNESATVNIQCPIGGEWVDFESCTNYDLTSIEDAVYHAIEFLDY